MADKDLTLKQQATNSETQKHIRRVGQLINKVVSQLLQRAEAHDETKLASPEVELFTEMTPKLAAATFPSEEYDGFLKELKVALDHHYARNRHHPEHFKNGVDDMNIVDLVEMLADWKAASERQHNGNLRKSIEANAKKHKISPQIVKILENSMDLFD